MENYFNKYKAKVVISDPVAVQAKCTSLGWVADNGAVFCSCPEAGFEGVNLIYCRYGLSIPYLRVQDGWDLWVEPTIGTTERWIYTGIADSGTETVGATIQMAITLAVAVLYVKTAGTIHIGDAGADEAFVLGTAFKTELDKHKALIEELQSAINTWTPVPNDGGAALKAACAAFLALPLPDYSSILSTIIMGK